MRAMLAPLRFGLLLAVVLPACAGVSPRRDSLRVEDLETRELSAAQARHRGAAIDRAISAVVQRRYDEAEAAAQQALTIDPRAARAHAIQAMVTLQQAQVDDPPDLRLTNTAEARMNLAARIDPSDPFVGWMYAVMLAQMGHVTAAAETAEAFLARAGNASDDERAALLGIAGTYRYELGEENAALPHLQGYVALRRDDAAAQFRLGSSLLRIAAVPVGLPPRSLRTARGQAADAAKAFERCWELAPGDEDAALAVATALLRAAELDKQLGESAASMVRERAVQQLQAVAAQFPVSGEALFRLGVLAEAQQDLDGARARFQDALQRDPAHLGALLDLAALCDAAGQHDEAAALLQRVVKDAGARERLSDDEWRRLVERLQRG